MPAILRILHIIESGGGSGRHIADLASRLAVRGHQVHALVNPKRLEDEYAAILRGGGVRLTEVPMQRGVGPGDLVSAVRVAQWLAAEGRFDVIHTHSSKAGALGRLVASDKALRVYTPHAFRTLDPALDRRAAWAVERIERLLRRKTDLLICVSEEERLHAVSRLGYDESDLATILNGVAPAATEDRMAQRRELGFAPDDLVFAFIGRLCAQKDPGRFLEAATLAAQRNERVKGVVLGDGELAPLLATPPPMLRHFRGLKAEPYLASFDALVCTSRYEGMPYIFAEALHAGLPIISTRVGGATAAIVDEENGLILPQEASASDVASAMLRIAESASVRARWSAASRARAALFDVEAMVTATETAYLTGLSAKRARNSRARLT